MMVLTTGNLPRGIIKGYLFIFGTEWGSGVSYPIKSALTSGGSLLDDTPPPLPSKAPGKKAFLEGCQKLFHPMR